MAKQEIGRNETRDRCTGVGLAVATCGPSSWMTTEWASWAGGFEFSEWRTGAESLTRAGCSEWAASGQWTADWLHSLKSSRAGSECRALAASRPSNHQFLCLDKWLARLKLWVCRALDGLSHSDHQQRDHLISRIQGLFFQWALHQTKSREAHPHSCCSKVSTRIRLLLNCCSSWAACFEIESADCVWCCFWSGCCPTHCCASVCFSTADCFQASWSVSNWDKSNLSEAAENFAVLTWTRQGLVAVGRTWTAP